MSLHNNRRTCDRAHTAAETNSRAAGHLHYARHFGALAAAALIMLGLRQGELLRNSLWATFAINGSVHACATVLSLRAPTASVARKAAFLAIAAALSILTLYVGIIGLALFATLPANQRLYVVLGLCSLSGAVTYGSLIRIFWIKSLFSRTILSMAVVCLLATSVSFFVRVYWEFLGAWWLAVAWWFAFSASLWYFDTHGDVLGTRGKMSRERES